MATYWENSCSFGLRYVLWYKYLIVGLVFSHLGFWSGNLFLIAPFPNLCLLVPYHVKVGCDGVNFSWTCYPDAILYLFRPFQLYGIKIKINNSYFGISFIFALFSRLTV